MGQECILADDMASGESARMRAVCEEIRRAHTMRHG